MAYQWKTFQSSNAVDFTKEEAEKVIKLLKDTAKAYERDFLKVDAETFASLVNSDTDVEGKKYNWIKLRCRYNGDEIDIVIVYHLLKHMGLDPKKWSVSVGFKQDLVPALGNLGTPNDPADKYVILAREIYGQIDAFASSSTPQITSFYWIDDDDIDPKKPQSEVDRRGRQIGELIWIAEHDHEIRKKWPTWSVTRKRIPDNEYTGFRMTGYSPDEKAEYMYLTEVRK